MHFLKQLPYLSLLWHKDIYDFLDLKTNNGDDRRKAHDIFPACAGFRGIHTPDSEADNGENSRSRSRPAPRRISGMLPDGSAPDADRTYSCGSQYFPAASGPSSGNRRNRRRLRGIRAGSWGCWADP